MNIDKIRSADVHTVRELQNRYNKQNVTHYVVEKNIEKRINHKTKRINFTVTMQIKGRNFKKTYDCIEKARIFRDTILKHFEKTDIIEA